MRLSPANINFRGMPTTAAVVTAATLGISMIASGASSDAASKALVKRGFKSENIDPKYKGVKNSARAVNSVANVVDLAIKGAKLDRYNRIRKVSKYEADMYAAGKVCSHHNSKGMCDGKYVKDNSWW